MRSSSTPLERPGTERDRLLDALEVAVESFTALCDRDRRLRDTARGFEQSCLELLVQLEGA